MASGRGGGCCSALRPFRLRLPWAGSSSGAAPADACSLVALGSSATATLGGSAASAAVPSAAPAPLAALTTGAASSQGLTGAAGAWLPAAGVAVEAVTAFRLEGRCGAVLPLATPLTVSGPDTLHSTATSSCSDISSICFRAAASSSGENFFRVFLLALLGSSSAGFTALPSPLSASASASASEPRPLLRPSSSCSTPCASFFASSRLLRIALRMKPMPMSPVVGISPPASRPLISLTVSFLALSTVSPTAPRLPPPSPSESDPLRSTASESSDCSGFWPRMARRRPRSSSCAV
mmetsp:Transcript_24631/g.77452  ORF Transcript_24631/g.77452 Transcript_24631/m.77452 type:complete len:294 (+) Transcript_24631:685-1566(+)